MKETLKNIVYGGYDLVAGSRGIERTVGGEKIRFPIRYARYYPKNYEPELFKFLDSHCRTGSTFLDCGAHFGLFSIAASRRVGDKGRVIGFEPAPSIRAIYQQVVDLNGRTNIEVRPEALSMETGTATFFETGSEASNANSLARQERHSGGYTVDITTIDNIMDGRNAAAVSMKIDVEGAEYGALCGAAKTLEKFRPAIFLSLHPDAIVKMDADLGAIWDLLAGHEFSMRNLGREVSRQWFVEQTELFDVECLPREGKSE
jgi:FkbM family methyltransferase